MIKAEIVAHSLSSQGDELISVLCTFPRIILAEVNTHRMLSKNTSSSRAIPFNKMVEAVQNNPFIPLAWQKNHKGMQGSEYLTDDLSIQFATSNWLSARDNAIKGAKSLYSTENGYESVTKQLCNRLLEPFMWTTMLITGSKEGWDNFFRLRCGTYELADTKSSSVKEMISKTVGSNIFFKDYEGLIYSNGINISFVKALQSGLNKGQAEIHMMALAESIYDAVNESIPKQLKDGEWHIPMIEVIED